MKNLTFKPITLDSQGAYRERLRKCNASSDYTFVNLWGWRKVYGLEWAWDEEEELVWIRQTLPSMFLWAPIGRWEDIEWNRYVSFLKEFPLVRIPQSLFFIWEQNIAGVVNLEEDRDNWDYIYLVEQLCSLKGNRFHKKKNLLRQFEKRYDWRYVRLEGKWVDEATNFQADWCFFKDCDDKDILYKENEVILDVFYNWEKIQGLIGGGIVVQGELVAYTVAEPLNEEMLVIHFEKGCPKYKGVYQAINNIFLRREGEGFKYVNREQDLGDRGLRQAKLSYNPCCFFKKYKSVGY